MSKIYISGENFLITSYGPSNGGASLALKCLDASDSTCVFGIKKEKEKEK